MDTHKSVAEYVNNLSEERREAINQLRTTIKEHLPEGYEEKMSYDMIGYVVPLSTYQEGYHAKKGEPLPFIQVASRKNFIALYHMGLYTNEKLQKWFEQEYEKAVPTKLDMGKSCVRFKNINQIPYDLIGELCEKITVEQWIKTYEQDVKR